jgi:hypothetical protein
MNDIVKELKAWKLRREGQSNLARLKGLVKKLHRDSQCCARGAVVGSYELYLQVLFKTMNKIILSRQGLASGLLI